MKGVIHSINYNKGMVAIRTEEGSFSIFEILSDDGFEIGDHIKWSDGTSLGDTKIINLSSGLRLDVYFQSHDVSKSNLKKQLLE